VWPTESSWGGDSLMGRPWPRRPPGFGSLSGPAAGAGIPKALLELCRADRAGLDGEMVCGRLDAVPVVAICWGPSSQAARFWFTRIWAAVWDSASAAWRHRFAPWGPFQEAPWLDGSGALFSCVWMTPCRCSWGQPRWRSSPLALFLQAPVIGLGETSVRPQAADRDTCTILPDSSRSAQGLADRRNWCVRGQTADPATVGDPGTLPEHHLEKNRAV